MKFYFFAIYLMIGLGFTTAYEDRSTATLEFIPTFSRMMVWPMHIGIILGNTFYENQVRLGRIKSDG